MAQDSTQDLKSVQELLNSQKDRSVDPAVVVFGNAGRDSGGTWRYLKVSSSGALANDDAGNFRISAIGLTASVSAIVAADDAGQFRVSAIQIDAGNLHVSAFNPDAGLFHVSAIGGTSTPLSASSSTVSAVQGDAGILHVSGVVGDAGTFRVSAVVDSGSVSAIVKNYPLTVSGTVSAFVNQGTVSAYSPDASLFRVSSMGADAGNDRTSALQGDAGLLRISSMGSDAGNDRTSAILFGDTTGQLTVKRFLSVSAPTNGANIKSTAGSLYGWSIGNSGAAGFLKFTNTSGNISIGTDTPIMTLYVPTLSRQDYSNPLGLRGFTAGIGVYATSVAADNATTGVGASAISLDVYYI